MKLISSVSSILMFSRSALAGYDQIYEMMAEAEANLTSNGLNRNLGGGASFLTEAFDKIKEYGCWCYFPHENGLGSGEPQNEMDAHCQTLKHGYSCAKIDGQLEEESCDRPWEVTYNIIPMTAWMFGANDDQDMLEDCKALNPDSVCAARVCAVDSFFTLNLIGEFLSQKPFDANLQHFDDNGEIKFDTAANCPRKYGTDQSPLECCGKYPPRFPYKTKDGQRGCCGDKTYDVDLQECCADNTLSLVC